MNLSDPALWLKAMQFAFWSATVIGGFGMILVVVSLLEIAKELRSLTKTVDDVKWVLKVGEDGRMLVDRLETGVIPEVLIDAMARTAAVALAPGCKAVKSRLGCSRISLRNSRSFSNCATPTRCGKCRWKSTPAPAAKRRGSGSCLPSPT